MTQADKSHLFVYGTLRRHTGHTMSMWLATQARFVGNARLQGRLYLIDPYPGAVESDTADAWVHGEILELLRPDATLQQLDDYEQAGTPFHQPAAYRRDKKPVLLEDGSTVEAWVYLYNRPTDTFREILSGDFLSMRGPP
jgi:gamma-glutamylcyclotransferase (GGCT)/AIG2-like uncharacterized protein YtfP